MRVSERLIFSTIISQLQRQTRDFLRIQEQVATGSKINRPSDDPVGQALILGYDANLTMTEQFMRNNDQANSLMVMSESALALIEDQIARAHELAVQMASGTVSAGDRGDAATEVSQIFDQIISAGNTTFGGRYIFAGTQILTAPFISRGRYVGTTIALPVTITTGVNDTLTVSVDGTSATVTLPPASYGTGASLATMVQTAINNDAGLQAAGLSVSVAYDTDHLVIESDSVGVSSNANVTGGTSSVVLGLSAGTNQPAGTYIGDSGEISIEIGSGSLIESNIPGDRLIIGTGGGVNVLTAVGGLQTALETDNTVGIESALTALGNAQEQIIGERGVLGARMNRIDVSTSTLRDFRETLIRLRSERADVDIGFAASELAVQHLALQASQAIAARMFDTSLIQFLR